MSGLNDFLSNHPDSGEEPERLSLHLPSAFSPQERCALSLTHIANIELELRKGEENDAVRDLRTQVNYKVGLEGQKWKHVRQTLDTTRAAKIIRDAVKARDAAAARYSSAREAIVALGGGWGKGVSDANRTGSQREEHCEGE